MEVIEQDKVSPAIPGYKTKAETAAFLNKSEATLDRWHRLRVGPVRTLIGRTPFYREEALRAWLLAQEQVSLRAGR